MSEDPRHDVPLSDQLQSWLEREDDKTLMSLVMEFGPHSFAILFVVLMAIPALPIPTGGISHVLEIATMLLALELMVGRTEVWIPRKLRDRELKAITGPRFSAALLKWIRRFERFSKPRMDSVLRTTTANRFFGLVVLALTVGAFLAPPFSGLDTLPSLGLVVLSLGILFGDVIIVGIGLLVGAVGVGLILILGRAALSLL